MSRDVEGGAREAWAIEALSELRRLPLPLEFEDLATGGAGRTPAGSAGADLGVWDALEGAGAAKRACCQVGASWNKGSVGGSTKGPWEGPWGAASGGAEVAVRGRAGRGCLRERPLLLLLP